MAARSARGGQPGPPSPCTAAVRLPSLLLAAWLGRREASRGEITKHLWQYVKGNELQVSPNVGFGV